MGRHKSRHKGKTHSTELYELSMANFLIGAKVINVDENGILIIKDGTKYFISYCDEGSYSDWWEVNTKLLISKKDLSKNPIITNVKQNGDKYQFVLFGMYKPIAEIKAKFHNESDWDYGCTCTIYANKRELVKWYG